MINFAMNYRIVVLVYVVTDTHSETESLGVFYF